MTYFLVTPHFNQKSQVMGVIILKYSILRTGSCLKLCGQLELHFNYLLANNKSKGEAIVYRYGKKHIFQFICKNRNLKQMKYEVQIRHRDMPKA